MLKYYNFTLFQSFVACSHDLSLLQWGSVFTRLKTHVYYFTIALSLYYPLGRCLIILMPLKTGSSSINSSRLTLIALFLLISRRAEGLQLLLQLLELLVKHAFLAFEVLYDRSQVLVILRIYYVCLLTWYLPWHVIVIGVFSCRLM